MAALTVSASGGYHGRDLTWGTLTASDTYTYQKGDILIISNGTAGAVSLIFTPSYGDVVGIPGWGIKNTSLGYTADSVAINFYGCLFMDDIYQYLGGTVTITGGSGCGYAILRR